MPKILICIFSGFILAACAQHAPTPEQLAARQKLEKAQQDLVAAECKLYEGTKITPDQCKKLKKGN